MRFIVGVENQTVPAGLNRETLFYKLAQTLEHSTAAAALSDALGCEVRLATEEDAASGFFEAIEATGGVMQQRLGSFVPAAEPDWINLGNAYVDACIPFGREPLIVEEPNDGNDDDAEVLKQRDRRRGLYGPECRAEIF